MGVFVESALEFVAGTYRYGFSSMLGAVLVGLACGSAAALFVALFGWLADQKGVGEFALFVFVGGFFCWPVYLWFVWVYVPMLALAITATLMGSVWRRVIRQPS